MADAGDQKFATGGLASLVPELGARIVILPGDPMTSLIRFDAGFWRWFSARPTDPFQNQPTPFGPVHRPSSLAAVECDPRSRDASHEEWRQYLAVYRCGGLEIGLGKVAAAAYHYGGLKGVRSFNLINIVGRIWVAFQLFGSLIEQYGITGPFEATVALHDTAGAIAAGFAAGWPTPGSIDMLDDPQRCFEPNVLVRIELDHWPGDDVREQAFKVGEQVANAFGVNIEKVFVRNGGVVSDRFDAARYG